MKPNTTCAPARSRSRAQRMLASSSKRAFNSTSAVTDLPASAASISASHDGAVGGGAVERLLDRDDVGIARRLVQELHDDVERFVRVVDDEILEPDRREAVAAVLADALGKARDERRKFEIGPVDRDEPRQFVQPQHSVDIDDARGQHVDVAGDEAAQRRRHPRLDLQPDHRAAPAQLQRAFVEAHQVLGLLLHLDVAVADDAETALPRRPGSRETAAG